jgi:hypothetical protein
MPTPMLLFAMRLITIEMKDYRPSAADATFT